MCRRASRLISRVVYAMRSLSIPCARLPFHALVFLSMRSLSIPFPCARLPRAPASPSARCSLLIPFHSTYSRRHARLFIFLALLSLVYCTTIITTPTAPSSSSCLLLSLYYPPTPLCTHTYIHTYNSLALPLTSIRPPWTLRSLISCILHLPPPPLSLSHTHAHERPRFIILHTFTLTPSILFPILPRTPATQQSAHQNRNKTHCRPTLPLLLHRLYTPHRIVR